MTEPRTVFQVFYRTNSNVGYTEFRTNNEILDVAAASRIKQAVVAMKNTKDVYVSTSKVRTKLDGSVVSEPYNYLVKK